MTPHNDAAFLAAFCYLAAIIAAAWLITWLLCRFAPNVARGIFGQLAEDNEADVSNLDRIDWAAREQDAYRYMEMHANANIAKRRRQQHGRQQMRDIWTDGGGSDAA